MKKKLKRLSTVVVPRLVVHLYCCGCGKDVQPRLTDGAEIYPHRDDLASLPFWKCHDCGNHVGCHHKTANRTKPLGCIPTPEIRNARSHLHALIDPVWKSGQMKRGQIYAHLSKSLGRQFHTADIRSVEEAREVYRIAKSFLHNAGDVARSANGSPIPANEKP